MIKNKNAQRAVMTVLLALLLCAAAPFSIPLGPLPFSFATLAVLLCGALLPPLPALLATAAYLVAGLCGAPVFADFQSGTAAFSGAAGGFLAAYPLMALSVSVPLRIRRRKSMPAMLAGALLALLLYYLMGTIWYCNAADAGVSAAISACVLPHLPFDIIKAALATVIAKAAWKTVAL